MKEGRGRNAETEHKIAEKNEGEGANIKIIFCTAATRRLANAQMHREKTPLVRRTETGKNMATTTVMTSAYKTAEYANQKLRRKKTKE